MECSPTARLLFVGLWNFCDDGGCHPASAKTIKAEVFPGDDISSSDVQALIHELIEQGLLREYEMAGKPYWCVTGWHHQKIDKPTFKYPRPPEFRQPGAEVSGNTSSSASGDVVESSPPDVEGKGEDGLPNSAGKREGKKVSRKTSIPEDFIISERVKVWAKGKGLDRLEEHLEAFKAKCAANGYAYADHDAAFMEAIRGDWAKLGRSATPSSQGSQFRGAI